MEGKGPSFLIYGTIGRFLNGIGRTLRACCRTACGQLSCAANLLHPEESIARPYNMVWGLVCAEFEEFCSPFRDCLLGACAETTFLAHATKVIQERSVPNPAAIGNYKIGNPYQINGVWYYPKVTTIMSRRGLHRGTDRSFTIRKRPTAKFLI